MKIEIKNKKHSKISASIYYDVFVDEKYYCRLRVSDHIKKEQNKILFFWSYKPSKIKQNTLLKFLEEEIGKREKRNNINILLSNIKIKNY